MTYKDSGNPWSLNASSFNAPTSNQKHNIKCFKCLGTEHFASQCSNKIIILLKDNNDIDSASDSDDNDNMPSLEDVEYLAQEKTFVIRSVVV